MHALTGLLGIRMGLGGMANVHGHLRVPWTVTLRERERESAQHCGEKLGLSRRRKLPC
jgi:hypothetical protein